MGEVVWTLVTCLVLTLAARVSSHSSDRWVNNLGGMLSRSCLYGFGISGFRSVYDDHKKDRQWEINCSRISSGGLDSCRWTYEFVNQPGENLTFNCDRDGYIAGLYSDYDDVYGDRMWRIECCYSQDVQLGTCIDTDTRNVYKGNLLFTVPVNKVLHGLTSTTSPRTPDRIWSFHICDLMDSGERP